MASRNTGRASSRRPSSGCAPCPSSPSHRSRFKRDCLAAWERRVAQGFAPEQIIDAYCRLRQELLDAKRRRHRRSPRTSPAGSKARAGSPPTPTSRYRPTCSMRTASPWTWCRLAQADPDFAKLWRRVETQRCVIRSMDGDADGEAAAGGGGRSPPARSDGHYKRYLTPPARSATGATSRCSSCSATPSSEAGAGARGSVGGEPPCRSEGGLS